MMFDKHDCISLKNTLELSATTAAAVAEVAVLVVLVVVVVVVEAI